MPTQITPDDFESLATKLESLDLTDAEHTILDGIVERAAAAEDEVSGFIWQMPGSFSFTPGDDREAGDFRAERLADAAGVRGIEARTRSEK